MFKGDGNLRSEGQKVNVSKVELEEYIKCKEDIIYFAEKYFYIVSTDKGKMLIPLREYQKRILKAFVEPQNGKRHCAVLSSRQIGKCVLYDTSITIRNKKTGQIEEISIGKLFDLMENKFSSNLETN
jgi:hypothetical protein